MRRYLILTSTDRGAYDAIRQGALLTKEQTESFTIAAGGRMTEDEAKEIALYLYLFGGAPTSARVFEDTSPGRMILELPGESHAVFAQATDLRKPH